MQAFKNCDMVETIVIPSSVTFLGTNAFQNLDNLTTVYLTKELKDTYGGNSGTVFFTSPVKDYIELDDNPFTAGGKTATVKAKKVKKKAQTVAASKLYKYSPSTGILAEKVSGNKNFTVNKLNGNITVKKKTKKGTYMIKVRIMSTGNAEYKASEWKTITVTIKVK